MNLKFGISGVVLLGSFALLPLNALADFDISLGFNFNQTTYAPGSFSWTRRWGASIGYEFLDKSELELAFQDVMDRTKIEGYEDTTFHDRNYSFNWVQSLTPRTFPIQPFVKIGVAQLNRDAEGSYANGAAPTAHVDSLSGVVGAGLRLYITHVFALRAEATSYLEGGRVKKWKDNISSQFGLSIYF